MEISSSTKSGSPENQMGDFTSQFHTGAFILHYQPQVHLPSRKITGYEGLIRWNSKGRILSPSQFLDELESTGLIEQIWPEILEQGVRQLSRATMAEDDISMALNVSPTQVTSSLFAKDLAATLSRHKCPPTRLEIEITERARITDHCALVEGIMRLKEIGVTVILDDFGAGHANLRQVAQLPVDGIKIDKYFTQRLSSKIEKEITKGVIELANLKGIHVLAEGVETKQQEMDLVRLGCTKAQGYLYGHPTPMICLETSSKFIPSPALSV